jgi:hypothetical protein
VVVVVAVVVAVAVAETVVVVDLYAAVPEARAAHGGVVGRGVSEDDGIGFIDTSEAMSVLISLTAWSVHIAADICTARTPARHLHPQQTLHHCHCQLGGLPQEHQGRHRSL